MKLHWYIHDEHCVSVETGAGRTTPAIEWRTEALRRVSAGWDRKPDRHTIEVWLRGGLPESGSLETFESHALRTIAERGLEIGTGTIHDWVWGNANWEYPGALRFERGEDAGKNAEPDGHTSLDEAEIGKRLRNAAAEADRVGQARRHHNTDRKCSLSGARGKMAVHIDQDGRIWAPRGRSLSTWIVKIENQPQWPGEAGVESVCQRALTHLDIDAATTRARVIDGVPVVMSRRSDRDLVEGKVVAKHQEDWLQAYGKPPPFKSDDRGPDLGFRSLYAILRRYGDDAQTTQVTRLLAAACAMCNGDLHRKNIGIAHGPPDAPFEAKLAPVYDFSTQCGVPRTGDHLCIAIAGMTRAWDVDQARWRTLAEQCRLDPDETVKTVAETALEAPEALATAREEARRDDEWREPEIVEQRIESTIETALRYAEICQAKSRPRDRRHGTKKASNPGDDHPDNLVKLTSRGPAITRSAVIAGDRLNEQQPEQPRTSNVAVEAERALSETKQAEPGQTHQSAERPREGPERKPRTSDTAGRPRTVQVPGARPAARTESRGAVPASRQRHRGVLPPPTRGSALPSPKEPVR